MMSLIRSRMVSGCFFIFSLLAVSGCSTMGHTVAARESLEVLTPRQSYAIEVDSVKTYEKDDVFVVQGTVKRSPGVQGRIRGHVDVSVIDAQGRLLAEKTVQFQPQSPHPNVRSTQFVAYLDLTPPPGAVVAVAAHKGFHR